ncbi:invertase-like protein (modular protein) [Xenorhabdus bovienii str. Jollieti]|nr:invertase-like protein (modular protein) [Xenorhabdus bovienii str. Jollieti]
MTEQPRISPDDKRFDRSFRPVIVNRQPSILPYAYRSGWRAAPVKRPQFKSLTDSIDTPSGRFFFYVMASLTEMERELIVERTRAGLDVARQLSRKPKMTDSKIESAKKLLTSGVPPKDVAKNLGVSVPTLYRWVPASTHT